MNPPQKKTNTGISFLVQGKNLRAIQNVSPYFLETHISCLSKRGKALTSLLTFIFSE